MCIIFIIYRIRYPRRNPGNTGDVYCEKGEEITAYKRKRSVFGELKIKIIYRGIKDIDSVL